MSTPNPVPTSADDGSDAARRALADALEKIRGTERRLALVFTADWCPDARALDAALDHPAVAPFVEPYEILRFDVGQRDRHLGLMADYGMDVWRGIPAVVVLDAEGQTLAVQRDGEFASARSLPMATIADFFHRWRPDEP